MTALFLAACSPSADVVKVPFSAGTKTVLLAAIEGAEISLRAIAVEGRGAFFSAGTSENTRLIALEYSCSLDVLGLPEGPVASGERALPSAKSIRELTAASEWREIVLPAELAALRIAGEPRQNNSPCVRLVSQRFALPGDTHGQATIAVPLDDRRAFIAMTAGYFFISSPQAVQTVELSSSTPARAGLRRGDEIFMIGNGGAMVRGDLELNFERAPPLPDGGVRGRWLAASGAGQPLELFAAHETGEMARFDGQTWSEIGLGDPDVPHAGIAYLGPNEAIFVGLNQPNIYHYLDGALEVEELPGLSSLDFPTSADFIEGFGVVAGTQLGAVYQRGQRGWTKLFELQEPQTIHRIVKIGEGLLIGARRQLVQYHPSHGGCAPQSEELELGDNDALIPLGGGWLLAGSSDPDAYVLRLERAPQEPDPCSGGAR